MSELINSAWPFGEPEESGDLDVSAIFGNGADGLKKAKDKNRLSGEAQSHRPEQGDRQLQGRVSVSGGGQS